MSDRTTGGPAFPAPAQPKTNFMLEDVTSGMSLRDWFAGQALAGGLATDGEHAYAIADDMIHIRDHSKPLSKATA